MYFFKKNKKTRYELIPFLFSFFNDFLLYYSFYVTFFTKHGFSDGHLAILLLVMNASKMISDVPVGIISDIYSRRNILIFGLLCRLVFCILCLLECLQSSYILCIVSMFIVGIGNSCLWTHTWNYFYDYLKEKKEDNKFSRFMGKFYAISNIAIACAGFLGGFVFVKINFVGIFLCSIVAICIAIFFTSKMPNYKPKTTIKTAKNIKISSPLNFLSLLKIIIKKPSIIRLLLLSTLMDSMFIVFLDINTAIMNYANINISTISQIVGIVAFIRIFSNYFSGYTERFMSFRRIHSLLFLLMVFSFVLSCFSSTWMIIVVSTYLCIYPFFDTSIKTKIEHKIDSNTRATIMSLMSLFVSILTIIFNSIIGIVAEQYNYFSAPVCIFMLVIIVLFFVRNIAQCYRSDINLRNLLSKLHK